LREPRSYKDLILKIHHFAGKQDIIFKDHIIGNDITIRIAYLKQAGNTIDSGMMLKYIEFWMHMIGRTISGSRIDFERKFHKIMKTFLRKNYNNMLVIFGYSLRAPMDMHNEDFSTRIALERLVYKFEHLNEFADKCTTKQLKRLR